LFASSNTEKGNNLGELLHEKDVDPLPGGRGRTLPL